MGPEVALGGAIGAQLQARSLDQLLADLAERQHGVVARSQLVEMGFGRGAVRHRLRSGRLHPLHRGIYAVGHKGITLDGHRMAAVLACGDGAKLSHRDAAAAYLIRHCNRRVFEVTVPRNGRPRPGIQLHFARLPHDEVTTLRGIPITTVARTLLDLAAVCGRREVERAMKESEVRRLVGPLSLPQLVARHPSHRGTAMVRAIVERLAAGDEITREEFVSRLLSVLDLAGLPPPRLNVWVPVGKRSYECDCVWWTHGVMAELDGYAVHGTRQNFESDRERDRVLQGDGWRVVRITWRQLRDSPEAVVRDLRALLVER
ncbi:MAG: type IV toxin-antitoxin system AbiEi family antitoxin domain-containing protein [Thermoleophilaceae bacterium]